MIAAKRLQQALFRQAIATNRADSSGVGSGFQASFPLSIQLTGQINQTFSVLVASEVTITNSSANITLLRTAWIDIRAQVTMAVTAGLNFAYVAINVDGVDQSAVTSGDGPKGYYTASPSILLRLQPGAHTIQLTGYVDNVGTTGKVVSAVVWVMQLGF